MVLEMRESQSYMDYALAVRASVIHDGQTIKYVAEGRSRLLGRLGASVGEFPGALDHAPLLDIPANMTRAFHADCAAAKVARRDGGGRVVDIHALRHTFGTMLAKAGVPLQVAQRAMRHSSPTLTANVYTHLGLLDVAGAVERLPHMGGGEFVHAVGKQAANSVTPSVTPNSDNARHFEGTEANTAPI